jgi:3-oxoacyl-[acyl-carrier protein] reductase
MRSRRSDTKGRKQMLNGEIALVTGASRGIGAAIAERLARDGARVIGTATTAAGAVAISAHLEASGGRGAVLDVGKPESIEALLKVIEATEGTVGILCNNAGITRDNLLVRMKQQDWDEVLDTNLAAVFRLSKAVLRGMMKARKGRIVSITSVVGLTGNAGQANYAAAKAGILGFTKSLAREVGSRGITVNAIAPGFIDTDMTRALAEAQRSALNAQIPLGRLGQPADIAGAVAFLCSPDGAYITGETLHVNGGMYMP